MTGVAAESPFGGVMRLVALVTILLAHLIGSTIVHGQGFRGAGGRGFAGAGLAGSSAVQGRQGPVSMSRPTAPAGSLATPQRMQTLNSPQIAPQRLAPQLVAPVPVFVSPGPMRQGMPGIVIGAPPHLGHYYPHYPRIYPPLGGVVILDAPYFTGTTVITQVAPGVVREERRYAEEPPSEPSTRASGQLAPFDPTPQEVVDRMLTLAKPGSGDVLYDLGAGDGRIVIAAAKKYRIKAVGYEIDPGLVKLARENIRKQGVEQLVEIREQDFLTADLSRATVVTLYLSYDANLALRPQLMQQLRPGARVVSYTFDMAEWQPKISERYRDSAGDTHMIFLWQIGEPLAFR
jgi:precorrin-6B methylase 2